MDFDLPDLLRSAVSPEVPQAGEAIRNLLTVIDRRPEAADEGRGDPADALSRRLLWVMAHYGSAAAASHGLRIGYVEGRNAPPLPFRLNRLAALLPSKLEIVPLRHGDTTARIVVCGGELSDFEKSDLRFLEHNGNDDARLGMVLVRCDEASDDFTAWVAETLARQTVMAHVLFLRPYSLTVSIPPVLQGWRMDQVVGLAGEWVLNVFSNPRWKEDLAAAVHLRYRALGDDAGPAPAPGKVIPVVGADDFGGVALSAVFPSETLAGPEIIVHDSVGTGPLSARLSPITTQNRFLYECRNVCVSHTGVVWRDDRALAESFLSCQHDNSHLAADGIFVTEPTETLEGVYFLASTGNPHHSHLIWETLRKLHFVEPYQPNVKLLAPSILTPSQRDYLPLFGFPPERCVFKEPGATVRVERLLFAAEAPQRYDRLSARYLRDIGARFHDPGAGRPKRIYLSRRDSRIYRNLVNEPEIEDVFREFGFTVILASDLSAQQKVELFSSARIIAGPMGAAFAYMPFALNAEGIFLSSDLYFPNVYIEQAAARLDRINYIRGIGLRFYTEPWGCEHSSFHVPTDTVVKVLRGITQREEQ